MKQINIGGLPFREMRSDDKYYVDKTLLIRDMLRSDDRGIYLFTRPRRFGKTTNLSTLDAFFNIEYKDNTWFDGLAISDYSEYERYKNAFPVIRVDLRAAKEHTYDDFIEGIRTVLSDTFEDHRYLLDSDDLRKPVRNLFESLDNGDTDMRDLKSSLRTLSGALEKYHGRKVVLLIDEYDYIMSDTFESADHRLILDFIRQFLGQALKGNDSLQLAYVTGIMQITKESIFSDLNNINVDNIFSTTSDERFGFTESEVRKLLEYYGHPEKMDEVRDWYDGYRFGNVDVYNPFSIMNYVSKKCDPQPYWVNSGGNWIIKHLLQTIDEDSLSTIVSLTTGNSANAALTTSFSYDDLRSSGNTLYSLMAISGYLKAVPDGNGSYKISVPNREVNTIVDTMMANLNPIKNNDFERFNRAVLEGDADGMASVLQKILLDTSYMNLRENAYEMIVMTIMHGLTPRYDVKTEMEEGYGRTDIVLRPKASGRPNLVFELKVVDSQGQLDSGLDEAMEQIHDRKYYIGMSGKVVLVAMSFWNKVPKVRTDVVTVPS